MSRAHDRSQTELDRLARYLEHLHSRRDFLRALGAAGAGAAVASTIGPAAAGAAGIPGTIGRGLARNQDTPVQGGTLNVAITGQPDSMDPHKAGGYASLQIFDNIYSKLVYVDKDLNYLPGLASKWTNTSPTEWVFELVQNAVFHNGEKFTSADVKYTFDRVLDPATASPSATRFSVIQSVEPVDDYTIKFTLKTPSGPFLAALAGFGQILNEKAVTAADPARNPVGTGPFKFVDWITDDHLTLARWDQHYKEGKPHLDQIVIRGMGVDESRMAALQSGEVNWVDAIPLQKVAEVRDGGEFNYYTAATAGLPDYVAMNVTKPPFDNAKLRQAVSWAIDRNAILQLAYSGVGEVANEEVATGNAWNSGLTTYSAAPDLDKAKQLLTESGFDTNQTITYLGLPQYPELLRTGEILKDNLEAIGIKMNIEQQEVTVWINDFLGKNYEITSGYWSSILDPADFYDLVMLSTSANNFCGYANPAVDKLIEDAHSETDFAKRKALYQQIREILNQDVPLTFVHYELLNYATAQNVQGTQILPSMELRFEDVWIKE